MDPSTLQHHHHHQEEIMASQSLDSMLVCTKAQNQGQQQQQQEKKPRPPDETLKCPRCDSTNTKFCYYNNYSLSQPRYFCKSCRRYWTKGGTLRNVPVGGGCRKNRRSSSSSSRKSTPDHQPHHLITPTNHTSSSATSLLLSSPFDPHHPLSTSDLTLAFANLHKQVGGGFDHHENHGNIPLLGNPTGNPHFDLFGNSFLDQQNNGGLQHLYYGLGGSNGSGSLGDVENGGGNTVNVNSHDQDHHHHHQMGMQFDHHHHHHSNTQEMLSNVSSGSSTPTTIKQEIGENRVLFGFPWQLNSGESNYIANSAATAGINELDSLKECWNNAGVLGPSWHSLLNSPLM